MTSQGIDAMEASRRLDCLVARRVMGWTDIYENGYTADYRGWEPARGYEDVPHYSSDIAAAWQVIEKLKDSGWDIHLRINRHGRGVELYGDNYKRPEVDVIAETSPLAICRAALIAFEILGQKKGA